MSAKKRKKTESKKPSQPTPVNRYPIFDEQFRADLKWWYKSDPKIADKILDLISDTMRDPFSGLGKPEPLKHLDSNIWSRRITLEHRLVYRVENERVDFLQSRYHY